MTRETAHRSRLASSSSVYKGDGLALERVDSPAECGKALTRVIAEGISERG